MRFGYMTLPRSPEGTVEAARLGEDLGFDWFGVADSPSVYQECFLHLQAAAAATARIRVGPVVTHLVARHPLIVGNLLATLNEMTGGRVIAAVGTGNSAARGLGLAPARVADLRQGIAAIQSYWRGEGGPYRTSRIPRTGIVRRPCPLLVSADGPAAAAVSAETGDGLLYGGSLQDDVLDRRFAAARAADAGREVWVAPAVSVLEDIDAVRDELGAMVVAMANRALRGDLRERGIPEALDEDVRAMWRGYDYGAHADTTRPRNLGVVSDRLGRHLVDSLCLWGDERRWAKRLDGLEGRGCTGVMFILGQADQVRTIAQVGARLRRLGRLPG